MTQVNYCYLVIFLLVVNIQQPLSLYMHLKKMYPFFIQSPMQYNVIDDSKFEQEVQLHSYWVQYFLNIVFFSLPLSVVYLMNLLSSCYFLQIILILHSKIHLHHLNPTMMDRLMDLEMLTLAAFIIRVGYLLKIQINNPQVFKKFLFSMQMVL